MFVSTHVKSLVVVVLVSMVLVGVGTAEAQLDKPGISVPWCSGSNIMMYWHTQNSGDASAPAGWRVERRHYQGGNFVTQSWNILGNAADSLQTFSSRYWDWTDSSARQTVSYTYRVRALNAGGTELSSRNWSRRAPVRC